MKERIVWLMIMAICLAGCALTANADPVASEDFSTGLGDWGYGDWEWNETDETMDGVDGVWQEWWPGVSSYMEDGDLFSYCYDFLLYDGGDPWFSMILVDDDDWNNFVVHLETQADGDGIKLVDKSETGTQLDASGGLDYAVWYEVCIVVDRGDADKANVYVNGVLAIWDMDVSDQPIHFIGADTDAQAQVDNTMIYDYAYIQFPTDFNPPPVVDAGPDQAWYLEDDPLQLDGAVTDEDPIEGDPGTLSFYWVQISGPNTVTFIPDPPEDVLNPTVTFDAAGTYEIMLQATDGDKDANDIVVITVKDHADDILIGHWEMEDNLLDTSINTNNGTPMTVVGFVEDAAVGSYALHLNNPNPDEPNAVHLGAAPELDIQTVPPEFSVSAWIKTTSSSEQCIISKGGDDGGGIRWVLRTSGGEASILTDDNDNKETAAGGYVADGLWHHVLGICDGQGIRIYVDGVFEDDDTRGSDYDLSGTSQKHGYIGANTSMDDTEPNEIQKPFDGLIDDVRVYNYVLPLDDPDYMSILELTAMGPIVPTVNAGEDIEFPWKPGRELPLDGVVTTDLGRMDTGDGVILWSTESGPDDGMGGEHVATFVPTNEAVTIATFPAAGVYLLKLSVTDSHAEGGSVSDTIEVTVIIPTCAYAIADGFGMLGDIAGGGDEGDEPDCHVGLVDLVVILANWSECKIPLDPSCDWPF